ncbi:hypothetical protein JJQ72_08605 [Paenibacillus sp. F411]|uniref:hypothetical protein n=1 Tax=Paenibacillus sp. F411 TaxID=2820239 RepID=UPI001AAFBDF0|nr:hypothetical protein [Paenibacillus sp. F411]MBO2944024.1 hypothetical protein [Paenibacillus sp. F411]
MNSSNSSDKDKDRLEHSLVNERDINKESGLFAKDSYPDGSTLPEGLEHEFPDGTRNHKETPQHDDGEDGAE